MIQVSGLEFEWDGERPFGSRVAINSLLAEGGHRQEILAGKERRAAGDLFSIVAQQIRRRDSIAPPQAGRIARVGGERRNQ